MYSTVQQVLDAARELCGDTATAGTVFTDTGGANQINLRAKVETALGDLIGTMHKYGNPFLNRYFHVLLPAYQSMLDPVQGNANDVGEIREVYWKQPAAAPLAILAITPNAANFKCRIQTTTPHGRSSGDSVIVLPTVGGVVPEPDIHGEWPIAVVDADEFDLLGCLSTGVWTTGGTIGYAAGDWNGPMASQGAGPIHLTGSQDVFVWEGDVLRLAPASYDRILKVAYTISSRLPADDAYLIRIDDAGDFLAYRSAALALQARGQIQDAAVLNEEAMGRGNFDEPGGMLAGLIDAGIRGLNKNLYQLGPYRERRNTGLPGSGIHPF